MHPKTSARRAALKALVALETREINLAQALDEYRSLAPETTRPLVRELCSGVLRQRARLDWTLASLLKKPLEKLDVPVVASLRLCCYERAFLKTPAPVAGNEYATVLKREKLSSAAGLLTAIARRLPDAPRLSPDVKTDAAAHLAIEYSHPRWMVERWLKRLGFEECALLLESNNRIAPLTLRVNSLQASRAEVLESLRAQDVAAQIGDISSDAIVIENGGDPTRWPEWDEGKIIAQDEGAQMVGLLAAPRPGQIVIDTCAAPGGKSTHLAQLMNDEGQVIAVDFPGRLKLVRENAGRLKIKIIETREGDFRELSTALPAADLVLLDAPCSGTGTLRRRPDARWKRTPEQLGEMVKLQRELLDCTARAVKPGGFLVYSTCSLESEENEGQIEEFLKRHANWKLQAEQSTWPHRDGCDGAYAAKLLHEK